MQAISFKTKTQPINHIEQKNSQRLAFRGLYDACEFNSRKDVAIQYMKTFKNGQKDALRKINKLSPSQYKIFQEALRVINTSADTKNPFMVFSRKLQCDAGYQDIAQKVFRTKDNAQISLEITFDENLAPSMSRTEFYDGKVVSWLKDAKKTFYIEKVFDEVSGTWQIENKFEIVNNSNNEPSRIIHSKKNEKLPEFVEVVEYNLADYDEDIDIISAIKNGTLNGGKKLSSIEFGDNSFEILQSFIQNDTKTKRAYSKETDSDGNILKTKYSYKIFDYFDNEIMDVQRTFEVHPEGSTTTVVGNKTYKTTFDDYQKVITIKDEKSKSINLDVKKYRSFMCQDLLYDFLKKMPADLLIQLYNSDVREIKITDNPTGSYIAPCANGAGFRIELGVLDEESFAHELGHIIDYSNFDKLLENQDIKFIYNAEWEILKETNPSVIEKELKYFSQNSPAKGINIFNRPAKDDGGLREMIAEVNLLTKSYGLSPLISKRANALVEYFPNTIALIARELEASTLI